MRVIPVINQIKAQCPTFSNRVDKARSLEALPDSEITGNLPRAFVYSSDEDSPGRLTNDGAYQEAQRVNIILVSENIDVDANDEPLEDLKTELRAALNGFEPDLVSNPLAWTNGRVLSTSQRMVWWVETFETFRDITS